MQKLELAYFGSPSFSADFLEKMVLDKKLPLEVILVVTQPDKPVGRNQILTPSPVKLVAKKYSIRVVEDSGIFSTWGTKGVPTGDKNDTVGTTFDLALVYAYGKILPNEILSLPPLGFWNIHPSLLPLYRGASPIAYPLIMGDTETGVSIIQMNEKMDEGPILAQEKIQILPNEIRTDLEVKLTNQAFFIFKNLIDKLFVAKNADFLFDRLRKKDRATKPVSLALDRIKKDAFKLKTQNHRRATYTFRLKKSDGFIEFGTLKKMLNNEKIDVKELPLFLQKYLAKYSNYQFSIINQYSNSNNQSKIENWVLNIDHSSKLLFNLFRGLYPWPGLWTLLPPITPARCNSKQGKRLKITEMKDSNTKFVITKVQLEGKKEVDFETFQKTYRLF